MNNAGIDAAVKAGHPKEISLVYNVTARVKTHRAIAERDAQKEWCHGLSGTPLSGSGARGKTRKRNGGTGLASAASSKDRSCQEWVSDGCAPFNNRMNPEGNIFRAANIARGKGEQARLCGGKKKKHPSDRHSGRVTR